MGLIADLLPVKIVWPDGHVEARRGRAFVMADRVIVHLDGQAEPLTRPIVGGVTHERDRWSVPIEDGILTLVKLGCAGCSPLRRLTPPRQ